MAIPIPILESGVLCFCSKHTFDTRVAPGAYVGKIQFLHVGKKEAMSTVYKYTASMQKIYGKYAKNIWQVCKKYTASMQKYMASMQKYTASMQKIYSKYAKNIRQVCKKIYGKYAKNIRQVCKKYIQHSILDCMTYPLSHLEVRELLLDLGSLQAVALNLLLELLLPPLLASAIHAVVNAFVNLICFSVISFVGSGGKEAASIAGKLGDSGTRQKVEGVSKA